MILCLMFVLHFIADFLLQSREMGQKKSSEVKWLLKHLLIQTVILIAGLVLFVGIEKAFIIGSINALVHGLIDWNIWKLYKFSAYYRIKKGIDKHLQLNYEGYTGTEQVWKYWEDHWFYSTIGFDQMLHGLTLIILAGYL